MTEQQITDAINALQIEQQVEHATRRMGVIGTRDRV
jgi:hypothetical protein